ncbi:MAG: RNA polymerase sigma factor [Rudaea sp.]|uniref:RNA polymerase sigma factor n=1 Tax=Rudaea sp. TaxID=2136325 RepID=UPI0039E30121
MISSFPGGMSSAAPEADDAFAHSLATLTPSLRHYVCGQLGAVDGVDDVVQESCLRALRYRGSVGGNDLRALLYRIAANVMADRHRRTESHRCADHCPLDVVELPTADGQPEQVQIGRQNLALILVAIRGLPPRCRDAFLLHRFEGLSYRDIAQRFGTSPRTVENQIAHALAACRRALGD